MVLLNKTGAARKSSFAKAFVFKGQIHVFRKSEALFSNDRARKKGPTKTFRKVIDRDTFCWISQVPLIHCFFGNDI